MQTTHCWQAYNESYIYIHIYPDCTCCYASAMVTALMLNEILYCLKNLLDNGRAHHTAEVRDACG